MPIKKLIDFLDAQRVRYVMIRHSPAYTAQEIAACAHVSGRELAKTVMVKVDDRMVMVVLPATQRVEMRYLKEMTGADKVSLASESEFSALFPGCEVGAMPPFGNLYGMDVFVTHALTDDRQIAFNAGNHSELLRMDYDDFERLVNPKILAMA